MRRLFWDIFVRYLTCVNRPGFESAEKCLHSHDFLSMQRSPFPPGSGGVRNWSDFAQGALIPANILRGGQPTGARGGTVKISIY